MRIADILLEDFDVEISNTRRTIERLPDDKGDWQPHAKSMAAGKLAMHCATIALFGHYILEDDSMDLSNSTHKHADLTWKGREHALAQLDEAAAKCRASLAATGDEAFEKDWKFSFGEAIISNVPRSKTFRMMCFDHMIHHTAQLGVYLRLLDVPVPALYGPSADEQWLPK